MNRVNYQTLMMMMIDAPRYVRKKTAMPDKGESAEDVDSEEEKIFKYYQSQL